MIRFIAHATCKLAVFLMVMVPSFAESQTQDEAVADPGPFQLGAAMNSDGSLVVTVGDAIRVFDIQTGEIKQKIDTPYLTRDVAFLPTKPNSFIAVGDAGNVFLGTVGQPELVEWYSQPSITISNIVISADGKTAITSGMIYDRKQGSSCLLQRFDVGSGKLVHTEKFREGRPRNMSFSHDQTKLAVAVSRTKLDGSSRILIYDTDQWQVEKTISLGQDFPVGVCFLPDDQHLLISGGKPIRVSPKSTRIEGKLWITDSRSMEKPQSFPTNEKDSAYKQLVSSLDGNFFITATSQVRTTPNRQSVIAQIQCRDSETGKILWKQDAGIGWANGVMISPDGKLVIACSDDKLFLFHAKTGHRIAEFDANSK